MSKPKIVSIEIELTNYEPIKFTMNEARELYEQLHELFGDDVQHTHYHRDHSPLWWYQQPHYTWTNASGTAINLLDNTTTVSGIVDMAVASADTGMKVSYLSQ